MAVHFTMAFTCHVCRASIRFEDEAPAWALQRPSRKLTQLARAFVQAHPAVTVKDRGLFFAVQYDPPLPAYVGADADGNTYVRLPAPVPYFLCPACGEGMLTLAENAVSPSPAQAPESATGAP